MKKIGLIGGTGPESTIIYYKELTQGVQKRFGTDVFPHLVIESLSVFEVLDFCNRNDYSGLEEYLLQGITNLKNAGAEYAALTGITPHIVFDHIASKAEIPMISMVETACSYSKEQKLKRIALLGTLPTMNGTFFQKPFLENGIDVITPNETEKQYIGKKIETELEFGLILDDTRIEIEKIALRLLKEEKVDAIVLGCTELPLIFKDIDIPIQKLDVMQIHIESLIDIILKS